MNHKDSIAKVLFAAAWADGQVSDLEKQALSRALLRLGYNHSESTRHINVALAGRSDESIDLPVDPEAAPVIMRFALAICLADGDLAQAEVEFLASLATHLCLTSEQLDALRKDAEDLVADQAVNRSRPSLERVQALLPGEKVPLADNTLEHQPRDRARPGKPSSAVEKGRDVLFEGHAFGKDLEL